MITDIDILVDIILANRSLEAVQALPACFHRMHRTDLEPYLQIPVNASSGSSCMNPRMRLDQALLADIVAHYPSASQRILEIKWGDVDTVVRDYIKLLLAFPITRPKNTGGRSISDLWEVENLILGIVQQNPIYSQVHRI